MLLSKIILYCQERTLRRFFIQFYYFRVAVIKANGYATAIFIFTSVGSTDKERYVASGGANTPL